jgi:hypothetical protein
MKITGSQNTLGRLMSEDDRARMKISGRVPALIAALVSWMPISAAAQQATYFWGTVAETSYPGRASSEMHVNNGLGAGQVNAARVGILYEGTTISILSIGSQNVVSTSIIGNDNSVNVTADQDSSNTGDVSNSGSVSLFTVREEN